MHRLRTVFLCGSTRSINTQLFNSIFIGTAKKSFSGNVAATLDFKNLGIPKTVNGIPINLRGLGRYASLLYTEAAQKNEIEKREQELLKLNQLLKKHDKFLIYIKSPVITRKQKSKFVKDLLQKYFSPELVNFLQYLAVSGRLPQLSEIINIFHTRVMPLHKNEIEATIITAAPLTAKELEQISLCLRIPSWSRLGQKIKINTIVNPSILGGIIVQLGAKKMDLSVQSKLNQYQTTVKQQADSKLNTR